MCKILLIYGNVCKFNLKKTNNNTALRDQKIIEQIIFLFTKYFFLYTS